MNSGQTQVLVVIIEISCSGKGKSDQWVMKKPDYMYPMRDRDTLIGTACVCVGGGGDQKTVCSLLHTLHECD